jgi:hypothetical protein
LFVYYEKGNPQAVVAPDVFVVMGAGTHDRPSYRVWQEPKAPDWVMEITSKRTHSEDQGTKRRVYALLGVQEYWLYDPTGDYLEPPLQGFRLVGSQYQPLPATPLPDGNLSLRSEVLGLDIRLVDGRLRFVDPTTGQSLRTHQEAEQAYQQARQDADQARQEAAARIAALEAELQALRAERASGSPPSADETPLERLIEKPPF